MTRPALNPSVIQSGQQGWDTDVTDNDADVKAVLQDVPFAAHEHVGDETDLEATFPAAQHDRCLVWVDHTTWGWTLYWSNGATWGPFAAIGNQVDSTAPDVATLVADFNALLAKLRAAGVLK